MNLVRVFQRQSQQAKTLQMALPGGLFVGGAAFLYYKRSQYLADPVLQRAILHLKNDQRVIDFCGENIKPGLLVSREKSAGENWVKYSLNVTGASGKLQTTVIGDYLEHKDLVELDRER